MKKSKSSMEHRIALLESRSKDNSNIVRKIKRKIRNFS